MTVIRPNSVSGITSITAQANEINFFRSNGTLAGLQLNGVNFNTTTGVSTFNNLNVGGVLTYQDVTNVDSVGIITARSGINVSGGQLDVGSNIKLGNAGVITATSVDINGGTITFGDSTGGGGDDRLVFGVGSDLNLYSDGTNVRYEGDNLHFKNAAGNQFLAKMLNGGAVELYHNNSKKFETLSYGVQVTGAITASNNINTGNNTAKFMSGSANQLQMYYDGTYSQINCTVASSLLISTNNTERIHITPAGKVGVGTNTFIDGSTHFEVRGKTANTSAGGQNIHKYGSASAFHYGQYNSTGDASLNNQANAILTFATNNTERVHITSDGNMGLGLTPAYSGLFGGAQRVFHIGGTAAPCLRITSNASGQADLVLHGGNSGRRADIANMATNGAISIWTKPSSGSIAERLKISSAGYVTKPATPAFFATHSGLSNSHTGYLTFNTSGSGYYNNGGHFDVGTGAFHAPIDGIYHFHFHGFFETNQSNASFELNFYRANSNGSGVASMCRQYGYRQGVTNQYGPSVSMHYTGPMSAGQTMRVHTSTLSLHGSNGFFFGGYLVG